MKYLRFWFLLYLLPLTSCVSLQEAARIIGDGQGAVSNNSCHEASNYICEIETEIHRLVNQLRRNNGKSTVSNQLFVASVIRKWNADRYREGNFVLDGLTSRIHNDYMNTYNKSDITIRHGHGCSGSTKDCNDADIKTAKLVAQRIVNNWMAKSEQKNSILSNGVTWQAAGVFVSGNNYYATQILGMQSN